MHSFQPSRGRIFFEVLCAVGVAASCGGAWMQTGASALLAAAGVATLYALVHFFDLFRREPSVAAEPQRIEFEPEPIVDLPARQEVSAQLARIEEQLMASGPVDEAPAVEPTRPADAQPVEPIVSAASEVRRTKSSRKTGGRRSTSSKKAKVVEAAPIEEGQVADFAFREEQNDSEPVSADESFHPPVAPLFEPEPFVRQQQRAMFGRKAG